MSFAKRSKKAESEYDNLIVLTTNIKVDKILFVVCDEKVQVYPRHMTDELGCFNLSQNEFDEFKQLYSKKIEFNDQTDSQYKNLLEMIKGTKVDIILFVVMDDIVQVYPRYKTNGLGCFNVTLTNFQDLKEKYLGKIKFLDYTYTIRTNK